MNRQSLTTSHTQKKKTLRKNKEHSARRPLKTAKEKRQCSSQPLLENTEVHIKSVALYSISHAAQSTHLCFMSSSTLALMNDRKRGKIGRPKKKKMSFLQNRYFFLNEKKIKTVVLKPVISMQKLQNHTCNSTY